MSSLPLDRESYPEKVSCQVLPELEEGIANIEVKDWDGNTYIYSVPSDLVIRVNMPRLSRSIPEEIREVFDAGIGLGLVACKVVNRHEDVASIQLPTNPEGSTVVVPAGAIARRM